MRFLTRRHLIAAGLDPAIWDAAHDRGVVKKSRPEAEPAALLPEGPRGSWAVEIPGWLPPSLNRMLYRPWKVARRIKRDAEALIALECRKAGVSRAGGRRRVAMVTSGPRRRDADNSLKAVLDGLVKCGALADDSERWCEWERPTHEIGPKRTLLTIEDI